MLRTLKVGWKHTVMSLHYGFKTTLNMLCHLKELDTIGIIVKDQSLTWRITTYA